MDFLKILCICTLTLGLTNCRKKVDSTAIEIGEAGYEISEEGWATAIKNNDVAVMRKMVSGGFDHESKDSNGNSGLHLATIAGSKEAAEYLLNRGHSVNETGAKNRTPLMAAVMNDQPEMVKWLLRQGADPKLKDSEDFMALMLAAAHDKPESVEELAPFHREDLDSALLLSAMVGNEKVIDVLTNYGASVYTRMDDGRTPLMLAAQNGHKKAVALLIDIGASRFATTENGDTAQSIAVAAGHNEIAELIETGFSGDNLAFETDEEVAEAMQDYLEEFGRMDEEQQLAANEQEDTSGISREGSADSGIASDPSTAQNNAHSGSSADHSPASQPARPTALASAAPRSLEGAQISRPISSPAAAPAGNQQAGAPAGSPATTAQSPATNSTPLIMRHYRQRELPVEVQQVSGDVASLRLPGVQSQEVQVRSGDAIPNSTLVVVRVYSRMEQGKLNNTQPIEVGIVEVEDTSTGAQREWIAGRSASAHDPVALVEDAATGQRYLAKPGQRFTSEDGHEFMVTDVRPSQLIIEDTTTGEVSTLPLRGPKG